METELLTVMVQFGFPAAAYFHLIGIFKNLAERGFNELSNLRSSIDKLADRLPGGHQ